MADGRKNNRGTVGNNGGRPPKATELELIERLSPLDNIALQSLKTGVLAGDFNFTKLFLEYRFGKPKQALDITTDGLPITGIRITDVDGTDI